MHSKSEGAQAMRKFSLFNVQTGNLKQQTTSPCPTTFGAMKRQILSYRIPQRHRHTVIAIRSVPNAALSSPQKHPLPTHTAQAWFALSRVNQRWLRKSKKIVNTLVYPRKWWRTIVTKHHLPPAPAPFWQMYLVLLGSTVAACPPPPPNSRPTMCDSIPHPRGNFHSMKVSPQEAMQCASECLFAIQRRLQGLLMTPRTF